MIVSSEELDRLFSELCAGTRAGGAASRARADVYVTGDPPTLVVELALPGLDVETVQIALEPEALVVQGERRRSSAGPRRAYDHAEIDWGPFARRLSLGRPVDPDSSSAEYRDGILALRMPLARSPAPGRVLVTVHIAG
ncbi:MAG: Hsp20/alpha crystallin family protein [Thermoleophilia bacterium]|nr:Hsp20/alpha crystallin family protein [Thermoleophilia bacterium]